MNYKNIDDSGWIPLDAVTALVGRNESGKTTLLRALHKFNPATPEPFLPLREFPRDRYKREFRNGADWPVCSIAFELPDDVYQRVAEVTGSRVEAPKEAVCTRFYDGHLQVSFLPALEDGPLTTAPVLAALESFASLVRRLASPSPDQEGATNELRTGLLGWTTAWQDKLGVVSDLRNQSGAQLLTTLRAEANAKSAPQTADLIEALLAAVAPLLDAAQRGPVVPQIEKAVTDRLPVFIYFENYGILDSAIHLPTFVRQLSQAPADPRVRTMNAMFKHVGLTADEISELSTEDIARIGQPGQPSAVEAIAHDKDRKDARAIQLNAASADITRRFGDWWSQRRHHIRYHADGSYFRIWVADDRRPDVEIELEARSRGFQWFFSFYLLFLVESGEGHKDAVLLLDEPGLDLHPTAQQELIAFFERLSEKNQLIYTTHSPFLIDGDHIERVRPVTEDATGHSRISVGEWPRDRETIFPLQAAAGYAMIRGLFRHRDNVLVEGMSDYYLLHALNQQCRAAGRVALTDSTYVTPCGGTKLVGTLASLFLGQEVRPLVLLDADDAGRVRREALTRELYKGHTEAVLMLSDALGMEECETEDILGEAVLLPALKHVAQVDLSLTADDRIACGLVEQVKAAAKRTGVQLPDGWKVDVALHLVSGWAQQRLSCPEPVLERAEKLFTAIRARFQRMDGTRGTIS